MAVHLLKNVQKIPAAIEKVWEFYATPANLQQITPDDMGFKILSGDQQAALYKGQVFEYKVSPLLGIPLYWKTEIAKVEAPYHFIDFQQKGPYKFWEHQHFFKPIDGGVEMTDIVHYQNPLWLLGDVANMIFIRKRLRKIFEFRFNKVVELFGPWPGGQEMSIEISRL
jgi:ligand-binding SRPBCC domain-containing protein